MEDLEANQVNFFTHSIILDNHIAERKRKQRISLQAICIASADIMEW
jgi:hypothetical protein